MKKIKGIFKVYKHSHTNHFDDSDHLIGRVMFDNGMCHILEDHDGLLSDNIHEGDVTEDHGKMLENMAQSGYFKVVPEEEIAQGLHEDLIPDLNIGETQPDHEYLLLDPESEGPPARIEVHSSFWILNGRNLNAEDKEDLLRGIREGRFQLYNI